MLIKSSLVAIEKPEECTKLKGKKRCAGMGGLQQTAINYGKQNIKPEKSRGCDSNRIRVLESPAPLSTPADVPSAKERAPRQLELMLMLTEVTTLCEK